MNEKQVKLLRYFAKHTGDLPLAGAAKVKWETLNHRKKGKLSTWMKRVIVTMMTISKEQKRAKQARLRENNKNVLDNFFASGIVDQHGRPVKL